MLVLVSRPKGICYVKRFDRESYRWGVVSGKIPLEVDDTRFRRAYRFCQNHPEYELYDEKNKAVKLPESIRSEIMAESDDVVFSQAIAFDRMTNYSVPINPIKNGKLNTAEKLRERLREIKNRTAKSAK